MSRFLPENPFPQAAGDLFLQADEVSLPHQFLLEEFFHQVRGDLFPRRLLTVDVQPQSGTDPLRSTLQST